MTRETDAQLYRYIGDHVDQALRWMVRYDEDDVEMLYHRNGIDEDRSEDRFLITVNQSTTKHRYVQAKSSEDPSPTHVELFDDAVAVNLRRDPTSGVVFSFDTPTARKLTTFVEECQTVFESDDAPIAAAGD